MSDRPLTEPIDPFPSPVLCPTDKEGENINGARFGCSRNGLKTWHGGLDLKAEEGTPFKAVYGGKVPKGGIRKIDESSADYKKGVGQFVIVRSKDFSIKYCHLQSIDVKEGDKIEVGQVLGKTGKSGNAYTVPFKHLHIELSTDHFVSMKNYVDPEPYLATSYGDNPNSPNHADCKGFSPEELDFVRIEEQ